MLCSLQSQTHVTLHERWRLICEAWQSTRDPHDKCKKEIHTNEKRRTCHIPHCEAEAAILSVIPGMCGWHVMMDENRSGLSVVRVWVKWVMRWKEQKPSLMKIICQGVMGYCIKCKGSNVSCLKKIKIDWWIVLMFFLELCIKYFFLNQTKFYLALI